MQTFTPIINNEGRGYRVPNIAMNISGERSLQEKLRAHELDAEGIRLAGPMV